MSLLAFLRSARMLSETVWGGQRRRSAFLPLGGAVLLPLILLTTIGFAGANKCVSRRQAADHEPAGEDKVHQKAEEF